jgi:hypothetical protein
MCVCLSPLILITKLTGQSCYFGNSANVYILLYSIWPVYQLVLPMTN